MAFAYNVSPSAGTGPGSVRVSKKYLVHHGQHNATTKPFAESPL